MGKFDKFCQSCGMPMDQDPGKGGTEKDGTKTNVEADHIIFENSFNQYISQKESEDRIIEWEAGSPGLRPTDIGNTAVQDKSFRERAAAIAFANDADKAILYKCRVIG